METLKTGLQSNKGHQAVALFSKTKMCSFHASKRCKYGDRCQYAHSIDELVEHPDLTKTSVCKNWKDGCCPLSSQDCPFAHGMEELRLSPLRKQKSRHQVTELEHEPMIEGSTASEWTLDACTDDSNSESDANCSSHEDDLSHPRGPEYLWDPIALLTDLIDHTERLNAVLGQIMLRQTYLRSKESCAAPPLKTGLHRRFEAGHVLAMNRTEMSAYPEVPGQQTDTPGHLVVLMPVFTMFQPTPDMHFDEHSVLVERMLKQAMPSHYED